MHRMDRRDGFGIGDERDPPPHFAGRKEELAWLQERLDRVCRFQGASGGISLVVGAPGAGKTHLAMEFAKHVRATRRPDGTQVAAKLTETSMLGMDDALLFVEVAKTLDEENRARKIADLDAKTTGRQFALHGLKYGSTKDVARSPGRLASLLEESRERGLWKRKALVLMFDELQTITDRQAASLATLHQGLHGCPIMLLGIGLQHTQAVLAELGISRTKRPCHLACLSREESLEAIRRGFEKAVGKMPSAGALAAGGIGSMRRRDAERAISRADAEFDGRDAIERAIRHGVLTQTDEDNVLFGIPSFHKHLVEVKGAASGAQHPPTHRQQLQEIE